MTADSKLINVTVAGVPVDLWYRTRDWFQGLLREFDILASEATDSAPRQLLEFVAETRQRFSRFGDGANAVLEEAHRRGEESIDLELSLPPEAGPVARELWHQIEHAEEYCRRGDLLTLTPDPDVRAYVRWYLTEVADQLEGAEPTAWSPQPPAR